MDFLPSYTIENLISSKLVMVFCTSKLILMIDVFGDVKSKVLFSLK